MYELGVAHTLGKETILIYQRGEEIKFPFDLAHIRRILLTQISCQSNQALLGLLN
jgi:hypothetical protein